jgi:fructose-specific component phosphotransferase system IIB-like protein
MSKRRIGAIITIAFIVFLLALVYATQIHAQVVRVGESLIVPVLEMDLTEEREAVRLMLGKEPLDQIGTHALSPEPASWCATTGTLPLCYGISLEGMDRVLHRNSAERATLERTDCYNSHGCDWTDGETWVTANGSPTSFTFTRPQVTPNGQYNGWVLYQILCNAAEAARGHCIEGTQVAEMRTTVFGHSVANEGFGRWNGTTVVVLDAATSNLGIDLTTSLRLPGDKQPGTNRNIRIRLYDDGLNEVAAYAIRQSDEQLKYGVIDNDSIRFAFADVHGNGSIRVMVLDSVDGALVSLRRVMHDPTYIYSPFDQIAQATCEPPVMGEQVDWDYDLGLFSMDPSPHTANHPYNWHYPTPGLGGGQGGHHAHEVPCHNLPGAEACYCTTPANMAACCAAAAGVPQNPGCEPFDEGDLNRDGVTDVADFNRWLMSFWRWAGM